MTNVQLEKLLVALVLGQTVIMTIWYTIATPGDAYVTAANPILVNGVNIIYTYSKCQISYSSGIISWLPSAALLYDVILLVYGIYLCITLRKINSAFVETKWISLSVYNITFSCVIYFFLDNVVGLNTPALLIQSR